MITAFGLFVSKSLGPTSFVPLILR